MNEENKIFKTKTMIIKTDHLGFSNLEDITQEYRLLLNSTYGSYELTNQYFVYKDLYNDLINNIIDEK